MNKRSPGRKLDLLLNLALIILAVVFIVVAWKRFHRKPVQQETVAPTRIESSPQQNHTVLINAPELAAVISRGENLIILDVDSRELFAMGHIPGATNIPFDELETRIANELSGSSRIVIYDHSGTLSQKAVSVLLENGLKAAILSGGYNEWQHAQK